MDKRVVIIYLFFLNTFCYYGVLLLWCSVTEGVEQYIKRCLNKYFCTSLQIKNAQLFFVVYKSWARKKGDINEMLSIVYHRKVTNEITELFQLHLRREVPERTKPMKESSRCLFK